MNIFSKMFGKEEVLEETEELEIADEPEEQLPQVPVRDIKAYLVDEYELSKRQRSKINWQQEQIEVLEETKTKYEATLVTLDEYSNRLKEKDREIQSLENKISDKKIEIDELNERINTLRINEYQKDEYRLEVTNETRLEMGEELSSMVDDHKGVLAKDKVKDWITELSEVQEDTEEDDRWLEV